VVERLGHPWPYLHEFLAIITHPRIFSPYPARNGVDQIDAWMESDTILLSKSKAIGMSCGLSYGEPRYRTAGA
jgi:hypothetical protein